MDPNAALEGIVDRAQFILGGNTGDALEETVDELAQQIVDLNAWLQREGFLPKVWSARTTALESACRGLLQDVGEVLERQGEGWWDETVTSGLHHRGLAEDALRST